MKNLFFRVDASKEIGTGHLIRCLTIAHKAKIHGFNIVFICKNDKDNLKQMVVNEGFQFFEIPKELNFKIDPTVNYSEWLKSSFEHDVSKSINIIQQFIGQKYLIIDHYGIDFKWETIIYEFVDKLIVIDDLADRKHKCDILIDQNFFMDLNVRYKDKLIGETKTFLGPNFAIFRDEFYVNRILVNVRTKVQKILIFFGGSDPTNATLRTLNLINEINLENIAVEVVVGSTNKDKDEIQTICNNTRNFNFHCQINYFSKLISECDLCIGAGGINLWERIFMLLPTITISVAENQDSVLQEVQKTGCIYHLGHHKNLSQNEIEKQLLRLIHNPSEIQKMSINCKSVISSNDKDYLINDILSKQ
ncbi:UDP-2,4-diacetamido-2,4,6-trideoxy-beta-L-altropyranose hydrolase [Neobacillus sp. KR4-4]|uniref:UDP-2,4-diacetamido-2,4, 6-trideoxy-beta-L-altropyranose hydrolase n=1 Tax=Neobacillus sp. KR4-4 TaxID=3344872 RepID=UPI0035CA4865